MPSLSATKRRHDEEVDNEVIGQEVEQDVSACGERRKVIGCGMRAGAERSQFCQQSSKRTAQLRTNQQADCALVKKRMKSLCGLSQDGMMSAERSRAAPVPKPVRETR